MSTVGRHLPRWKSRLLQASYDSVEKCLSLYLLDLRQWFLGPGTRDTTILHEELQCIENGQKDLTIVNH
jgi:hypothetical protein